MDVYVAVLVIVALIVFAVWVWPRVAPGAARAAKVGGAAALATFGGSVGHLITGAGTVSDVAVRGAPADAFALARKAIEEDGARVLYVSGPAGSGKSHLMRRLRTELPDVADVEVDDVVHTTGNARRFTAVYGRDSSSTGRAIRQKVAEETAKLVNAGLSNSRAVVVAAAARSDFWERLTPLLDVEEQKVRRFVIRPSVSNHMDQLVLRALRAAKRGQVRRVPTNRTVMLPRGVGSPKGLWEMFAREGFRGVARALKHLTAPYVEDQVRKWVSSGAYEPAPNLTVIAVDDGEHIARAARELRKESAQAPESPGTPRAPPLPLGSSFATREECQAERDRRAFGSYKERREARGALTSWDEIEAYVRKNSPPPASPGKDARVDGWRRAYPTPASVLDRSARAGAESTLRALRHAVTYHKRANWLRIRGGRPVEMRQISLTDYEGPIDAAAVRKIPDLARRPVTWCIYFAAPNDFWARRNKGAERIPDIIYIHDTYAWYSHVCEVEAAAGRPVPDVDLVLSLQDRMALPSPGKSALPHMPREIADKQRRPADDPPCAPVYTQQMRRGFDDVPVPCADDIGRALRRVFPTTCYEHYNALDAPGFKVVPWEERDARALFRGNTTGCGTRPKTNPRQKLAQIAHRGEASDRLFDVGFVGATSRTKRQHWRGRAEPPNRRLPKAWEAARVPFLDHGKYRVQIDVDGNVIAFRLAALFAFGSAVVRFLPEFDPWFADLLVSGPVGDRPAEGPRPNYYCVRRPGELVPLLERLATPEGSAEAEAVGRAGRELYLGHLGEKGMVAYTAGLLAAAASLPV